MSSACLTLIEYLYDNYKAQELEDMDLKTYGCLIRFISRSR